MTHDFLLLEFEREMGASLVFLVLRFSVVFWALPVHRSAGHVAHHVVSPAISPGSSIASHRTMVPSHLGKRLVMHSLRRPKIDSPAPHGSPLHQHARSWTDLDESGHENSHYKHHHHHHHHHHAKSQSPSYAVSPAYTASPSYSPYSPTTSQASPHAPSPMFSEMPIHSPSVPSPNASVKMAPPPSSTLALPPPPPNQDCAMLTCTEPLTYTPSGFTCGCVWPIQVKIRLSVALYTFFPLVSELAAEIATSLALTQSQVRIVGANAANQQLEKTVVLANLVPLETKFNYSAAFSAYQKFWHRQIHINSALFGAYEVLDVHYPGLPPSPPSIASNLAAIDDHPHPGNNKDNDGSLLKPLGVNVPRRNKNRSYRSLLAAIVLSSITAFVICASIAWVLIVRCKYSAHHLEEVPPTPVSSSTKVSGTTGATKFLPLGSRSLSGSLSFGSGVLAFTGSAKIFSLNDMERATNNFEASRVLGEGGFGVVYRGALDDGEQVAVKVLKRDNRHGGREFLSEVEMLSRLHHRNLVKLIGICSEDNIRCLVYELVPNGSVESHLHGVYKEIAPLDWPTRMKIALGAARGLAYLHEDSSPCVIHRDFKASNILLDHDFTPKVSDFGLARSALSEGNQPISTHVIGTFGYVAPEYAMTGHLLVKSDVYSYGVVLLELLTGRKPVDFSKPPGQENLVAWAHPLLTTKDGLEAIMDTTLKATAPYESFSKVAAIASMCVQPEVSRRPFMGEVVQALTLVCSEFDEEGPKTSFNQEEANVDEESKSCQLSAELQDFPGVQCSVLGYESGSDAKTALSATDLAGASEEFKDKEYQFLKRQCSSGPLQLGMKKKFWQRFKRFSRGSMQERPWSGSH